jgi:hypothetical protein
MRRSPAPTPRSRHSPARRISVSGGGGVAWHPRSLLTARLRARLRNRAATVRERYRNFRHGRLAAAARPTWS